MNPAQGQEFPNPFEQFLKDPTLFATPRTPKVRQGHFCNKCDKELFEMEVTLTSGKPRLLFYCVNNHCKRFGLVTVVAKLQLVEGR